MTKPIILCDHERLECPKHEGGFDCNSFCSTCEGNQEYCPKGCEMAYFTPTSDIIYVKRAFDAELEPEVSSLIKDTDWRN